MRTTVLGILLLCSIGVVETQAAYDHQYSDWQRILIAYTHEGRVNYMALKGRDSDLKASIQTIESLSKGEYESFNTKQKMVFWINAYNIGVTKTIVDNYPIKRGFNIKALAYPANSIQQISNVWYTPVLSSLEQQVSLNDIENKFLRPEFKDPRVHFAIVCASIGCPVIRSEAYTAEKLDQQLSEQIRKFLNDPQKSRYDSLKNVLYLSPIFKWFSEDFKQMGGVIVFIKKYAPADLFNGLSEQTRIEWLGYNWSLNEKQK